MEISCPHTQQLGASPPPAPANHAPPMCRQGLEQCVDEYHIIHELASSLIVYNQSKPACKPSPPDRALDITAMTLGIGSRASVWSVCGLPRLAAAFGTARLSSELLGGSLKIALLSLEHLEHHDQRR